jgi:hypothetical protein
MTKKIRDYGAVNTTNPVTRTKGMRMQQAGREEGLTGREGDG